MRLPYTRVMRALRLLPLLLALPLSGCRYNYVPLVPPSGDVRLPTRITRAELTRNGEELVLKVKLDGRLEPAYLRVGWFDSSRDIGSDSVYLDEENREATLRLKAPKPGAYRAVLVYGGVVLRQVELYEVQP